MAARFDTQIFTTEMTGAFTPALMSGAAAATAKVNGGAEIALAGGHAG